MLGKVADGRNPFFQSFTITPFICYKLKGITAATTAAMFFLKCKAYYRIQYRGIAMNLVIIYLIRLQCRNQYTLS